MNRIYWIITAIILLLVSISFSAVASERTNWITELVEEYGPATVSITTVDNYGLPNSLGSGFCIDSNGTIITNYHVIRSSANAYVTFPERPPRQIQKVLRIDKVNDLAVLKIEGESYPFCVIGNSDSVVIGEDVCAIGNPQGFSNTVSAGIISGLRREDGRQLLQTTAPISPGSSGGPIFNTSREVIGVAVGTWSNPLSQNLNFCVPSNCIYRLLNNVNEESSSYGAFDSASGEINVALSSEGLATFRYSSNYGDIGWNPPQSPVFINDGSLYGIYTTNNESTGSWMRYDFSVPCMVNRIRVQYNYHKYRDCPADIELHFSDGSIERFTCPPKHNKWVEFSFEPRNTSYITWYVRTTHDQPVWSYMSYLEWEVWGKPQY